MYPLAAALSAAICLIHIFAGGKQIAAPLRATEALHPVVRDTNYLCWHLTTAGIAAIALAFTLATLTANPAYAVMGTILSGAFAATGLWLVPRIGQPYRHMPQGWLFVPATLLGLWGLLG